jgi:signal transduction histidine kinase
MREEWRDFWAQTLRYLRYFPVGIAVALVPFLLNLDEFRARGYVLRGLGLSLTYGVVVSLSVFAHFVVVYAILVALGARVRWEWGTSLFLQVALAALGMVVGIWLTILLRAGFAGERMHGAFFPSLVFGLFFVVLFALYAAYRQAREHALAMRAAAAEARYHSLEQQMRPHFLFNSLNSLAELIETGQENAAEVTHTLADLYRQILTNSKTRTAPLASELEIARRYLELERLRFGRRLAYRTSVGDGVGDVYVPSLVIQTLVENAVKHGIAGSLEGGEVEVTVTRAPDRLCRVEVANTGRPWPPDATDGTGLANTRARLDLLYGDRHRFGTGVDDSGRTVAAFYFTGENVG